MPVNRKRFRIEQAFVGDMPMPRPRLPRRRRRPDASRDHERAALDPRPDGRGRPRPRRGDRSAEASVAREVAEAQALLETYRAQIEQCEKLKVELDLIHDAINRTKREIAILHGKSFDGDEMAKVNGELGAVVGGTEQATQQILEATEAIDQAATALSKITSPDQQKLLSEEIQERVISIFEACNFQDLTGQRISKVMTTMKFIENHINVMMDIWGGVDAHQGARDPDRRRPAKATPSCSTARRSTATSAMPRRTTSTRCSTRYSGAPGGNAWRRHRERKRRREAGVFYCGRG